MGNCFRKGEFDEDQMSMIKACTQMSDKDVEEWHKKFLINYPKGFISKRAFGKELEQLRKGMAIDKYLTERVFAAFDVSNTGEISFAEFMAGVAAVLGPTSEKKLEYCFAIYDKDNDRMLSKKEVGKVLRILLIGRVQTEGEVNQYVNTVFNILDTNDDEEISLAEFIEACRNDATIFDLMNPFA